MKFAIAVTVYGTKTVCKQTWAYIGQAGSQSSLHLKADSDSKCTLAQQYACALLCVCTAMLARYCVSAQQTAAYFNENDAISQAEYVCEYTYIAFVVTLFRPGHL
jgi:hypothetical protein